MTPVFFLELSNKCFKELIAVKQIKPAKNFNTDATRNVAQCPT